MTVSLLTAVLWVCSDHTMHCSYHCLISVEWQCPQVWLMPDNNTGSVHNGTLHLRKKDIHFCNDFTKPQNITETTEIRSIILSMLQSIADLFC